MACHPRSSLWRSADEKAPANFVTITWRVPIVSRSKLYLLPEKMAQDEKEPRSWSCSVLLPLSSGYGYPGWTSGDVSARSIPAGGMHHRARAHRPALCRPGPFEGRRGSVRPLFISPTGCGGGRRRAPCLGWHRPFGFATRRVRPAAPGPPHRAAPHRASATRRAGRASRPRAR